MNWIKTYLFFFFVVLIANLSAQSLNDYRSVSTGNWTTNSNWEMYDGSSWIPATNYPGEIIGTNDVTISNTVTITINSSITNSINSVTVGDKNIGIETLSITGISSINTSEFNIAYDGLLRWDGNFTFTLPNNASFFIETPNPDSSLIIGVNYGIYVNPTACNVNKKLIIGTTIYTNCNGGGPNPKPLTFEEANGNNGNLGVSPTSSSPVCLGNLINLLANPNGSDYDANPASATYLWSIISPTGNPFSSALENPTDTPTSIGNYTYQITITVGAKTNTNTVIAIINNCNKSVITNRRITYRAKK